MYAIYGNMYHQYTPNVGINLPYMDPMGMYVDDMNDISNWSSKGPNL